MNKETGGTAFPSYGVLWDDQISTSVDWDEGGMTLRDYFAAKAMQALIQAYASDGRILITSDKNLAVEQAYEVADAMLEARK